MGTNYYLLKKKNYDPKDNDYTDTDNDVTILKNGYVWKNKYYSTLIELNKEYVLPLHIGKSSMGWHFGLCIYPDLGINNLSNWIKEFTLSTIVDEYDDEVAPSKMVSIITERMRQGYGTEPEEEYEKKYIDSNNECYETTNIGEWYLTYDEFLEANHAERGKFGLLKHIGKHWTSTDGTYDLTTEFDFS